MVWKIRLLELLLTIFPCIVDGCTGGSLPGDSLVFGAATEPALLGCLLLGAPFDDTSTHCRQLRWFAEPTLSRNCATRTGSR